MSIIRAGAHSDVATGVPVEKRGPENPADVELVGPSLRRLRTRIKGGKAEGARRVGKKQVRLSEPATDNEP
jgi:hypothetical protein